MILSPSSTKIWKKTHQPPAAFCPVTHYMCSCLLHKLSTYHKHNMFSLKYSYSCFELQIFRMYCVSHDSGHYISLFILSFAFVWHEITCNTRKAKLFEKDMNVVVFWTSYFSNSLWYTKYWKINIITVLFLCLVYSLTLTVLLKIKELWLKHKGHK